MNRWFSAIFLALACPSGFALLLQQIGFGKLPGGLRRRGFGGECLRAVTPILLGFVASLTCPLI